MVRDYRLVTLDSKKVFMTSLWGYLFGNLFGNLFGSV